MYNIERWTGKAWSASMCSPYKTMRAVRAHLEKYSWHYTVENPFRIVDFKPKKKVQRYYPKCNQKNWNSDEGMVVQYSCRS